MWAYSAAILLLWTHLPLLWTHLPHIAWNRGGIWVIIAYAVWAFIYFAYSRAASGRTAGMALFGVRVVRDDGTGASGRRAVVRTLAPCRRPMRRPGQ